MVSLTALWLPILLSAVFVFIASSIMHMLLPYHRSDYNPLPDEEKVLTALRATPLKRGHYIFPYCTHKDMKSPAILEKQKQGPVGFLTIMPSGPPVMPKFLIRWFVFCLLVEFFVALLASLTLSPGAGHHLIIHVTLIAAFLGYGVGNFTNGIWRGHTWSATIKEVIDGLVYAVLTAATFCWLWPR